MIDYVSIVLEITILLCGIVYTCICKMHTVAGFLRDPFGGKHHHFS